MNLLIQMLKQNVDVKSLSMYNPNRPKFKAGDYVSVYYMGELVPAIVNQMFWSPMFNCWCCELLIYGKIKSNPISTILLERISEEEYIAMMVING